MSLRISFSKEYGGVELDPTDGRLLLTLVEAEGSDLDELHSSARISLETWHGNEGPDWTLDDLSDSLIEMIHQDFEAALQDAGERAAEAAAERQADVIAMNKERL